MSTPTFVASASGTVATAGTGPLTITKPSGTANGDLLLAFVSIAASTAATNSITPPSGWTVVMEVSVTRGVLYARIASSEPANYDWSVANSAEYNVIMHAYRPASGSWTSVRHAIGIVLGRVNASSATHPLRELPLPTTMDFMLVGFFALGRGSTTTTKPATYTLAENPDSGGTGGAAVESAGAYLSVTNGSAPADSFTTTNGGPSVTIHLAIFDPGTSQRLLRSHATAVLSTATQLDVPVPFCEVGDLLVAFIAHQTGTTSITTPSGWALLESSFVGGVEDAIHMYERVVTGSEGATQAWVVSSGTQNMTGTMVALTGVTGMGVYDEAADATADTAFDVPGLTMSAVSPHAILLAAIVSARGDRTISAAPSGHVLLDFIRTGGASGDSMQAVSVGFTASANPPAGSFTASAATTSAGIQAATATAAPVTGFAWGYILGG